MVVGRELLHLLEAVLNEGQEVLWNFWNPLRLERD